MKYIEEHTREVPGVNVVDCRTDDIDEVLDHYLNRNGEVEQPGICLSFVVLLH